MTSAEGADEASVERSVVGVGRPGYSNGRIALNGPRGGAGLCERVLICMFERQTGGKHD